MDQAAGLRNKHAMRAELLPRSQPLSHDVRQRARPTMRRHQEIPLPVAQGIAALISMDWTPQAGEPINRAPRDTLEIIATHRARMLT